MKQRKVISKGYTLTVTSWENDGDNYNTQSLTVNTKEEAKVWWDMMQLCKSGSNRQPGVILLGNSYGGFSAAQEKVAEEFIKQYSSVLVPDESIEDHQDELAYWFCDLAGELLGHGEDYSCRVMESCVVTYSPEDVFVEEITF